MQGKENYEPEQRNDLAVIDQKTGELVQADGLSIADIVKQQTGGVSNEVVTSIDARTKEGAQRLDSHMEANPAKDHKQNEGWYGREFSLVHFTSRAVATTHDGNGNRLSAARPLVRTIIEDSDGNIMSSSSSWLFSSLMGIIKDRKRPSDWEYEESNPTGYPSDNFPIRCKLVKAGASDKLQRVSGRAIENKTKKK